MDPHVGCAVFIHNIGVRNRQRSPHPTTFAFLIKNNFIRSEEMITFHIHTYIHSSSNSKVVGSTLSEVASCGLKAAHQ